MTLRPLAPNNLQTSAKRQDRRYRRADAGGISGNSSMSELARNVPLDKLDPVAVMQDPQWLQRRAAVPDLSFRQPRPTGVREVSGRRIHQRHQCGGRHFGVCRKWPGCGSWQEDDLARTAGTHCGGFAGPAWCLAWLVGASSVHRVVGFRRGRTIFRWCYRHLWHGHDAGSNAVESSQGDD